MENRTNTKKFIIEENYIDKLEKLVNKLNKKIEKHNLSINPIEYKIIKEDFITTNRTKEVRKVFHIEMISDIVKVGDFDILGYINHMENGNILSIYKDDILNEKQIEGYRKVNGNCEHCNINRYRTKTFLIINKDGNIKQVGKTCLNDFFGIDVNFLVSYLEMLTGIEIDIENFGDYEENFQTGKAYLNIEKYLQACEKVIAEKGYTPKSKANGEIGIYSTESIAYKEYSNNDDVEISDKVKESLNWIRNYNGDNTYLNNLKVICMNDYSEIKYTGYIASLLSAYDREIEYKNRQNRKQEEKQTGNYIGNVGDKLTGIELTLKKMVLIDTQYGTMFINIMSDINNNVVVYRGNKNLFLKEEYDGRYYNYIENKKIVINGKIKELSEYNGEKQTIIERPKVTKYIG